MSRILPLVAKFVTFQFKSFQRFSDMSLIDRHKDHEIIQGFFAYGTLMQVSLDLRTPEEA